MRALVSALRELLEAKRKLKSPYKTPKERAAAKEKFAKTYKLARLIHQIQSGYQKDIKSDDERTRAHATLTKLIDTIYARIGGGASEEETGSVGMTTLRKEHVTVNKNGSITLEFPGKSGVDWKRTVSDPALVKSIKGFIEGKKPGDQIFPVSHKSLNRYIKSLSGDGISAKDFRTYHANRIIRDELRKQPRATNKAELNANIKAAIEATAEALGHTPGACKKSYINPDILDSYRNRYSFA